MKKRYVAAVAAVACLAAAGGLAFADPPSEDAAPQTAQTSAFSAPTTVTLPGGDQVRVLGDAVVPQSTDGEATRFHTPRLPDGDRIVIPAEDVAEVSSGEVDRRLYNVDALLRAGYTDAREVSSPDELGEPATAEDSASAEAAEVTLTYAWRDGSTPTSAGGAWLNLDTGDYDFFDAAEGKAVLELEPGRYTVLANMNVEGDGDQLLTAGTVLDFEVGDQPQEFAVDAAEGNLVDFKVDRDAELTAKHLDFFSGDDSGETTIGIGYVTDQAADEMYAIASDKQDHPTGIVLRQEMAGAADPDEPYNYSLFADASEGIPADPTFAVGDDELASRQMNYNGLGGEEVRAQRANLSYHAYHQPFTWLPTAAATVPGTRTEYFTADEDVEWSHMATLVDEDSGVEEDALHYSGAMEPGGPEEMSWLSAPLSAGVPDPNFPYYGSGVERWRWDEKTDKLLARMPLFDAAAGDETLLSWELAGETVISKDGEELARADNGSAIDVDVPKDDEGRYTVTMDAQRDVRWTPLGTKASAKWEFDSAPVDEDTVLDVSAVHFEAEGVEGGYADAASPQDVALTFTTQPGAEDRSCEAMTFEVSYDDGETWEEVDVDRDGDNAAATLEHPDGAEFVSVRFAAADDRGQTVEHSAIRSYGLKSS
ncbi:MAG: hypothetical protein ACRDXX_05730 [Stackebrandtia sp.]